MAKVRPQGIRTLFLASLGFLLIGALLGYFASADVGHLALPILREMRHSFGNVYAKGAWLRLFWLIFVHNTVSIALVMLLGFVLGIYPAWNLCLNGLVIGYLLHSDAVLHGIAPWRLIVFGLAPHGIFELTAVFWASSVGLLNGWAVLRVIAGLARRVLLPRKAVAVRGVEQSQSTPVQHFREVLDYNLHVLPILVALLLVAAFIESRITPILIQIGIGHSIR
ncbi:MAG: stage II sporulation protein M [Alicyclobacillaceae bacterium]|nr:stage II sporulation protein M [Alicyclobacillaceae bacterium]MCY0895934.1 stage II sporulation protein M [Alicyclobacillaceae bacterium]